MDSPVFFPAGPVTIKVYNVEFMQERSPQASFLGEAIELPWWTDSQLTHTPLPPGRVVGPTTSQHSVLT